jgi:O-antigen/teichoic acid export membrane protein
MTERTEYFTAANWVAAGVALGGYLVLIPQWLAWGAAVTTVASFAVRFWLAYWFSQRLWPVRYVWAPVLRLATIALAVMITAAIMPSLELPVSLLVHGGLLAVFGGLLWRLSILTDGDRSAIRGFVRSPRGLVSALSAGSS